MRSVSEREIVKGVKVSRTQGGQEYIDIEDVPEDLRDKFILFARAKPKPYVANGKKTYYIWDWRSFYNLNEKGLL